MRSAARSILTLLLLSFFALPLSAQDIREISHSPRSGFWWGIGVGSARTSIDCSGCNVDPDNLPIGDLKFGGTVSPNVTIGLQVTGGQKDGAFTNPSDITSNVGDVNVSAYFYPSGNLWLQGGIGAVGYREKLGSNYQQVVGGALVLGAGFDLMLGGHMSITPSVRGVWGGEADVKDQDGNVVGSNKVKVSFIHAGVSLVWH